MTSRLASRFKTPLPILLFAAALAVTGCATQTQGPIGPISSGNPRVDPDPQGPVDPTDTTETETDETDQEETETAETEAGEAYTPPHMQGRDIVRAGVMLPFSDGRAAVRTEAEGMLAGIELALFDGAGDNFVILPKDTRGSQASADAAARELLEQGVDLILGPLYGANVTATKNALGAENVPIVSFSNDSSIAGNGVWLSSIAPEAEVAEMVRYAASQGYRRFAYFGPQSALGQKVERTLRFEATQVGGDVLTTAFYPTTTQSPNIEAETFAGIITRAVDRGDRVAIIIPERGTRLRRIAPLLPYYDVDIRRAKIMGLSSWNDPNIWREPTLKGAWFPAPPAVEIQDFEARYTRQYGRAPSNLAAMAYDAAALAIALSADGELTQDELTNRQGYAGINGLFRFRYDGIADRSLAIMEIDPSAEGNVKQVRGTASSFVDAIN